MSLCRHLCCQKRQYLECKITFLYTLFVSYYVVHRYLQCFFLCRSIPLFSLTTSLNKKCTLPVPYQRNCSSTNSSRDRPHCLTPHVHGLSLLGPVPSSRTFPGLRLVRTTYSFSFLRSYTPTPSSSLTILFSSLSYHPCPEQPVSPVPFLKPVMRLNPLR